MTDSTRPHDLRVNHLRAPLGVGDDPLRVSWKLPGQAAVQHAYRIVADAWDTGRVESAESLFVPVDAPPRSGRRVEWRVKTWTDVGESDWSETSWWEHGLLDAADWSARWVAPVESDDLPLRQRPAHQLGGTVRIEGEVHRARLYATAHGVYEAFVNGRRAGDIELTPGWTAYRSNLHVQTYDVSDLVVSGENLIGALLSDGWWRGQNSVSRRVDDYGTSTALLLQLVVDLASGETIVFGTDHTWRSTVSHVIGADLIAGEVHDLRRGTAWDAWLGWAPVRVEDHGYDELVRVDGAPGAAGRGAAARVGADGRAQSVGRRRRPEHQRLGPVAQPRPRGHHDDPHLRRMARRGRRRHPGARLLSRLDRGRTGGDVPGRHGDLGW